MEYKFAFDTMGAESIGNELTGQKVKYRLEETDIKGFIGNIVYVVVEKLGYDYLITRGFVADED